MKVHLAWINENNKTENLSLPKNSTVRDLLNALRIDNYENYIVVVNGRNRLPDHPLTNGDQIKLLLAMAGG